MTVLLTGGAGFIGSHTAVALLDAGHEIVIADNLLNSKESVLTRISKITGKSVKFYKADVTDALALERVFAENAIDAVVHFAGLKAVGESVLKPLLYYRNNLDSAITLLETMQKFGVKKLVFSSSATVYGINEEISYVEGMPTGCTNPYGWTKLMIEQILSDTCGSDKSLSVAVLRYFNPIGAHESGLIGEEPQGIPNNLLPYVTQVAVGKLSKLRVFGNDYETRDGTGVRDYIHVVDLARGHLIALDYADKHEGLETFNLGTGIGYSVLDIIKTFERVNGVPVPYEIVERRPGDLPEYFANPAKANSVLGWEAKKTLEDMCRDAWNWQKKNPEGYDTVIK